MIFLDLLGLHVQDLQWYQMLCRTVVVFVAALILIRLSGMRTFGKSSAFDVVVSISLGAIMGKCIMGHYPFFPGLLAATTLAGLHRLVAWAAARNRGFCKLTEGQPILLFSNGQQKERTKRKYNITDADILTALHKQNLDDFVSVKTMWLEPDGTLSVVKKNEKGA